MYTSIHFAYDHSGPKTKSKMKRQQQIEWILCWFIVIFELTLFAGRKTSHLSATKKNKKLEMKRNSFLF